MNGLDVITDEATRGSKVVGKLHKGRSYAGEPVKFITNRFTNFSNLSFLMMSHCSSESVVPEHHLGDMYTESGQTLQCSFSSVSTPPIARVGAFFSIFHDLQDIHAFAPLRTQNFSQKKVAIFSSYFYRNFGNVRQISVKFAKFS